MAPIKIIERRGKNTAKEKIDRIKQTKKMSNMEKHYKVKEKLSQVVR